MPQKNTAYKFICFVFLIILLSACSSSEKSVTLEQAIVEYDLLYDLPKKTLSFNHDVLPVLEKRCIACHGCYDAPCQLKLTSAEGILRGSNKKKVYDGARITAAEPTRLFVDAMTTAQWRSKDFSPVLYEKPEPKPGAEAENNNPVRNLEQSVLYRMLRLKQLYPQARTGLLSDKFDLSLDREQSCPTLNEFEDYARKHAEAGMPFAMPNLPRQEYKTLVHWIAQGSPVEKDLLPSVSATKQIEKWEDFLNGQSKKEKLVSRYLFEHLFHAHLHFEKTGDREFYRLVRSSTPPGESVQIIATRRPYGEADSDVYYRIIRNQGSVVAKQHMVYGLNAQRMKRYKELFYDIDYEVTTLPSYVPEVASNPIKAFVDIPVKSRYKFLLDEARFFIEGFIKGPVCRGQVALNVIEDQFWVLFFDPDAPTLSSNDEFLKNNADKLASPSELEDTFNLFSVNIHYKELFREYVHEREKEALTFQAIDLFDAMKYLWDGNSQSNSGMANKNAALTVFRHLDSASVNYGLLGDYPETAWILDYSVLERIHYLLVAGFDVYGNVGHQLNTRLYMDLLRTEGEDYFLAFLPVDTRFQLRENWYQGIRQKNKDDAGKVQWLEKELVKGYKTGNKQRELYRSIVAYLGEVAGDGDFINRCDNNKCASAVDKNILRADSAMKKATKMDGEIVQFLPDLAFVRVLMGGEAEQDRAYTMIYNKAYKSVSNLLEMDRPGEFRDYRLDTQTIVPWLEGSYPNFFYVVKLEEIENFVELYNAISNPREYEVFVARYGIRRTNENFWLHADWFNQQYLREQPVKAGIFDLNRYQNR
ncbi:MAG: fatty acid cis/trans isomerase [Gammaproteobacteria bacterium]|nr:MAG: fatty acid cis/trans isomerase [Gammaproteobacteria bacterium]